MVHPAGEEGGEFVVFIIHLAVRVIGVGLVGDGEVKMIVKRLAGNGVAGLAYLACQPQYQSQGQARE